MDGKLLRRWVLLLSSVIFVAGCTKTLTPAQIMELNRNGKWSQAAAAARTLIRESERDPDTGFVDTFQAYFQKAYAELRLGKVETARVTMEELDSFMDGRGFTADTRWMYRETNALRRELSLPPDVTRLAAGMRVQHETGQTSPLGIPVEARKALEAFRLLCEETGAQAAMVVKSGRVVSSYFREGLPQLYDAGVLGEVIASAAAFQKSNHANLSLVGPTSFASLREEVLRPSGMENTRIASSTDGNPNIRGPLYTTPGDLAKLTLFLQDIGYFRVLEQRGLGSPWREMHTPRGLIALGRADTFVATTGDSVVVRIQEPSMAASPRFQREAAPLIAKLALWR